MEANDLWAAETRLNVIIKSVQQFPALVTPLLAFNKALLFFMLTELLKCAFPHMTLDFHVVEEHHRSNYSAADL